jgi:hypothetical protein
MTGNKTEAENRTTNGKNRRKKGTQKRTHGRNHGTGKNRSGSKIDYA